MDVNEIIQIQVKETLFNTELYRNDVTWYADLCDDKIVTYRIAYESRKRVDKTKTLVAPDKMKRFFSEIYKFVRSADGCPTIVDDCSHEVTLVYSHNHREIIDGGTISSNKQLIAEIYSFMRENEVEDDWIS